jgi:hypothetical protein
MTENHKYYIGDDVQNTELFFRDVGCPHTCFRQSFVAVAVRAGLCVPPQTDDFCYIGFIDPSSAAPLSGSPYTFNMTPRRWRQTTRRWNGCHLSFSYSTPFCLSSSIRVYSSTSWRLAASVSDIIIIIAVVIYIITAVVVTIIATVIIVIIIIIM